MGVFDRAIKSAERQIEKYGQAITWRVVNVGVPADASKPWRPSVAADVDEPATICFLPMNRENKKLYQYLAGTNTVPTGYTMGLMKGNVTFTPKLKDVVIRGTETYRIKNFDPVKPNEQTVLYLIDFEA